MTSESGLSREALEVDELMRRSANGDQVAFGQIVERYRGYVIAVCRSEDSETDPEDMAQIALVKAWNNSHTYQGAGKFKSWLAAIARNSTKDERRRRLRRRETSLDELMQPTDDSAGYEPPSFDIPTEDLAISASYRQAIADAFALLNDNQRKVMQLLIFEEMHYEEISDATGLKVGTVKSTISRAREKMIPHLRERGVQWPPPR